MMNTPALKASAVTRNVFCTSRTYRGMMGLSVSPISKPSSLKRFRAYFVTLHSFSMRSGSFCRMCRASRAAAVAAGITTTAIIIANKKKEATDDAPVDVDVDEEEVVDDVDDAITDETIPHVDLDM